MSLKPPKKSDLGKGWMKPRRNSRKMVAPEYHLIVSEGTATEPLYFQSIKEIIDNCYRDRIHLSISGKGCSALGLFQQAKSDVLRSNNIYKHVWLVYDKDDFPPEDFNLTAELCTHESTEETCYHAIWSNQCIELWFLLHFMFLQSDIPRTNYCSKLTTRLESISKGAYHKGRTDMFDILLPYMDTAIQNAKKLEALHHGKPPSESAPETKMHLLIEKLKPYLE